MGEFSTDASARDVIQSQPEDKSIRVPLLDGRRKAQPASGSLQDDPGYWFALRSLMMWRSRRIAERGYESVKEKWMWEDLCFIEMEKRHLTGCRRG